MCSTGGRGSWGSRSLSMCCSFACLSLTLFILFLFSFSFLCFLFAGEPCAVDATVVSLHAPHHRPEFIRRLVQYGIESDKATREVVSYILSRATIFKCVSS